MGRITAWVSPHDSYQTISPILQHLDQIRQTTGYEVRVALPTLYGPYWQQGYGLRRSIGDDVAASGLDSLAALRDRFVSEGYGFGGWAVPLCDDQSDRTSDYSEGNLHGQAAGLLDFFLVNLEAGWDGFLARPKWNSVQAANDYFEGFADALKAAGRFENSLAPEIGLTFVTNTMLDALSDAAEEAWMQLAAYDALELYLPGDPNLDPYKGTVLWIDHLATLRVRREYVAIVEKGDLLNYVRTLSHPTYGIQLWSLESTAPYFAAQAPVLVEAPVTVDTPSVQQEPQFTQRETLLIDTMGLIGGTDLPALRKLLRSGSKSRKVVDRIAQRIRDAGVVA